MRNSFDNHADRRQKERYAEYQSQKGCLIREQVEGIRTGNHADYAKPAKPQGGFYIQVFPYQMTVPSGYRCDDEVIPIFSRS